MLSGQHTPDAALHQTSDISNSTTTHTTHTTHTTPTTSSTASNDCADSNGNGQLREAPCLITIENAAFNSTASMTKQLATTTTISNSQLAPSTSSPTSTSPVSATSASASATSPAPGSFRKGSFASATAGVSAGGPSLSSVPPSITTTAPAGNGAQQNKSSAANDASGRSAALERAYVHDVYENCEEPTGSIRPRVAQFLSNLDPGSIVCDVGCGSGRYLTQCNPAICTIGVDRCCRLSKVARSQGGEVALCDNLELPFRDESFDAVLSLAVVHHFATTERRISALRELARILRIGGRVVITVWALEQRHRRFESQDVLIPWQPPKNRTFNYSDEEDDDDFLPPYHAYTEDSTNSSRSAGDGDSSSLSSSSPGESCYSFVRRAIQKLAGGKKHPWFLDSWNSKDTKNDSSLDYEDAKDLPIELRRLEDFEDFTDPPLSAGLKSRSLGSILNPPPRQIVRSRSSVPSLGGTTQNAQLAVTLDGPNHNGLNVGAAAPFSGGAGGAPPTSTSSLGRRPKLIKQKQSLCDDDYSLPEAPFHAICSYNSSSNSVNSSLCAKSGYYYSGGGAANQHFSMPLQAGAHHPRSPLSARQMAQATVFLRKQSSLNEELMAGNRIREKERVRKRIQKQTSLNEAFLCRSQLFSKRLQVIREGFTTKIKSSTGSLERVTKTGLTKIMENFRTSQSEDMGATATAEQSDPLIPAPNQPCQSHQHHHHHHPPPNPTPPPQQSAGTFQSHFSYLLHRQTSIGGAPKHTVPDTVYCNNPECATTACYCSTYHSECSSCSCPVAAQAITGEDTETKARRHSRESGSDSSKDSLQSDTSIESEDSFASVIFIPKPEQHQQQLNYQQQHQNSNSSSSNSSSSNGNNCCQVAGDLHQQPCKANCGRVAGHARQQHHHYRGSSVPTSPLIMPCPPTPAHSPAAAQTSVTSPPQTVAAVTAAMAILTPPPKTMGHGAAKTTAAEANGLVNGMVIKNRFNFDVAHIKQQQSEDHQTEQLVCAGATDKVPSNAVKITRQTIKDLPPIPKFRKQQSLQLHRQSFPIVRRSSATSNSAIPSISKLMSLELFNPLTDDLDSDSSEPSSPDSIDSVISAPKSAAIAGSSDDPKKDCKSNSNSNSNSDIANHDDFDEHIKEQQRQYHNGDLKINRAAPNDIILNDDSSNILPAHTNSHKHVVHATAEKEDCAEFAEKLSAQLLREIEDKNNKVECRSLDCVSDIGEFLDDPLGGHKKRNTEPRDLTALRDELRERRLMLANLSTQPSLQQSPTSSSTSSRSFTIHEEDEEDDEEENERSYTLQLYENCKVSKFDYKRNRQYNLHPETAYLLQDDGDSSIRDDDDLDDFEHDVILEEDEDAAEEADSREAAASESLPEYAKSYAPKTRLNTIKCDSLDKGPAKAADRREQAQEEVAAAPAKGAREQKLPNRRSTESWEHSNSSTSLDSPSQGGGATTHHRYYHVFREGELDALINHHVTSLHIVSSYYERASWCVVAEKVQVWTI